MYIYIDPLMTFASSEDLQKLLTCQACCPQEFSKRVSISYLTVDIESLSTQWPKVLSKLKSPKKIRGLKLSAGEMPTMSSKKKHGKHLQPFSEGNWNWLRLATFNRKLHAMKSVSLKNMRY